MATNNQLLMHFAANQASSDNIWEAVLVAYNAHWRKKMDGEEAHLYWHEMTHSIKPWLQVHSFLAVASLLSL